MVGIADVFVKLSVGDGLVTQIPALIVSLAAGLLVSKGGTRGSPTRRSSASSAPLSARPLRRSFLMVMLALMPGLPLFVPFALLGGCMAFVGYIIPMRLASARRPPRPRRAMEVEEADQGRQEKNSVKDSLDREIEFARQAAVDRAADVASGTRPSAWARCARNSPRNTVSSCRRSSSPTISAIPPKSL
jgi:flagellar biosynthesis protein FlhA